MGTKEYFYLHHPQGHPERPLYARIGNALDRAGIQTMEQLSAIPETELAHIRSLGSKSLKIVLSEVQKYNRSLQSVRGKEQNKNDLG